MRELDDARALRGGAIGRGDGEVALLERAASAREAPAAPLPQRMGTGSRIESLGLALPDRRLSTTDLLESRRHRFRLDLERRTGIRERRVCSEGEDSLTLAVDAARDCLAHSRYDADDLEMVLSCSITRYRDGLSASFEPPLSLLIKDRIGAPDAISFDLSNACAGMLTGIHVLDTFIRRGVVRRGMVVSGEYISSSSANAAQSVRTIASRQIPSLTVGDSGTAVILERCPQDREGISASELVTFAEHSDLCIGRPSDDGPGAVMFTDSSPLHRAAIASSSFPIQQAIAATGLSLNQIDFVIPHQTAAPAIAAGIKYNEKRFGKYEGTVVYNVEEYGNTSSTTHFVALYRYLQERRFRPGDRILLLCTASGLTVGATVFTMDDLWERYGHGD
jgi:3-oxoacyl-[acyl-carrier-protein] synthase-3